MVFFPVGYTTYEHIFWAGNFDNKETLYKTLLDKNYKKAKV